MSIGIHKKSTAHFMEPFGIGTDKRANPASQNIYNWLAYFVFFNVIETPRERIEIIRNCPCRTNRPPFHTKTVSSVVFKLRLQRHVIDSTCNVIFNISGLLVFRKLLNKRFETTV